MVINDIVTLVNAQLAGERLTVAKVLPLLDKAIDDVNQALNADFPTASIYAAAKVADETYATVGEVDYDVMPPRYIRTVLALGAAKQFYIIDEEGAVPTPMLDQEYNKNLFFMQRDYSHAVPEEYQDCEYNGSIAYSERIPTGTTVLELPSGMGNIWR